MQAAASFLLATLIGGSAFQANADVVMPPPRTPGWEVTRVQPGMRPDEADRQARAHQNKDSAARAIGGDRVGTGNAKGNGPNADADRTAGTAPSPASNSAESPAGNAGGFALLGLLGLTGVVLHRRQRAQARNTSRATRTR